MLEPPRSASSLPAGIPYAAWSLGMSNARNGGKVDAYGNFMRYT